MNGYMKPQDIEKRAFEIITTELGERTFPAGIAEVVKRVIHTTADFDYADSPACFWRTVWKKTQRNSLHKDNFKERQL